MQNFQYVSIGEEFRDPITGEWWGENLFGRSSTGFGSRHC